MIPKSVIPGPPSAGDGGSGGSGGGSKTGLGPTKKPKKDQDQENGPPEPEGGKE